MSAMVSQITGVSIVYSTVSSGADQRKHQSSASLAFVRLTHRWPMNSSHKGPVARKIFPFDASSWNGEYVHTFGGLAYIIFQNQETPSRLGAALSCLAWPRLAMPCHVLSCLVLSWVRTWCFFVNYQKRYSYSTVVLLCIFNFSINRVFTADNNMGKI